jgi:hypothetical protein
MMLGRGLPEELKRVFEAKFGISLDKLYSPFWGLDIVAFVEWLKVPDQENLKTHIVSKYGGEALKALTDVLDFQEETLQEASKQADAELNVSQRRTGYNPVSPTFESLDRQSD